MTVLMLLHLSGNWPKTGILTSERFGSQNPFRQQGWGAARGPLSQGNPPVLKCSTSTSTLNPNLNLNLDQGAQSSSGKVQQPLRTE